MKLYLTTQAKMARNLEVSQALLSKWKKAGAPVEQGLYAVIAWKENFGKQNSVWVCPRCGRIIRHKDRPKTDGGWFKLNCGCFSRPKAPAKKEADPLRSQRAKEGRERHTWRRANPQADAHVILYEELFSKAQRKLWQCPYCQREVRGMDRPKLPGGGNKKHCGCRVERVADRSLQPNLRYAPQRRASRQRERDEMRDPYIKKLLLGKPKPGHIAIDYPQALIDLKREVVRIERFIKQAKETTE